MILTAVEKPRIRREGKGVGRQTIKCCIHTAPLAQASDGNLGCSVCRPAPMPGEHRVWRGSLGHRLLLATGTRPLLVALVSSDSGSRAPPVTPRSCVHQRVKWPPLTTAGTPAT